MTFPIRGLRSLLTLPRMRVRPRSLPVRLAHVAGVPATYYVPLYRRLANEPDLDFTVFFASSDGLRPFDMGFGRPVAWDNDLLGGYRSVFLRAADRTPGLGEYFWSVRNWDIVSALLRGRYDAVWLGGYNSITYLLAAVTQRARGGAVLFREDQTLLDTRSRANMIAKRLILRPLFAQGQALYTSTENRRWFRHFGVANHRLFPAVHSVDNDELQAAASDLRGHKQELRRRFGIADGSGPVIVTVCRLVPKKQPTFLLEAFRRVRQRRRCVLLVVGSGPMEAELRHEISRHQVPDVILAGFLNRSEIAEAYAVGDVFALLSRERETFGLVVSEAMNFGMPVIVSDKVGCATDLVASGDTGFVVSSCDPAGAAVAIERLVVNSSMRATMGAAARARIDQWSIERTAKGIVDAVLNGEASPADARGRGDD